MKIDDVLADEMVQLRLRIALQVGVVIDAGLGAIIFEAGQIANRRIQPHIEIFAGCAGDFETEVGRIARDIPCTQAAFGIQPFHQFGFDTRQRGVAG